MISVSLVILTMDRMKAVSESLTANIKSAGYPIHELIHVDNGSIEFYNHPYTGQILDFSNWFARFFKPDIQIIHKNNQGVSKGYNRGMMLATGSHIAITGCDRIMPEGWLKSWVDALGAIPNTGVISCYSTDKYDDVRLTSEPETMNNIRIQRSIPFEARIHSRELLLKAGFFREDFGLYGYEDWEWRHRVERICLEEGLINYVLPQLGLSEHLNYGDEGIYHEMKQKENSQEWKKEIVQKCLELGSPYYNPYSRIEAKIL